MADDSDPIERCCRRRLSCSSRKSISCASPRRRAKAPAGAGRAALGTKGQLAQAVSQNEKLSYTLREAREHIASLRDEVDKLTQPPSAYGVIVGKNDDARSTS